MIEMKDDGEIGSLASAGSRNGMGEIPDPERNGEPHDQEPFRVAGALKMGEGTAYIVRDGVAVPLRELRGEYRAETFWTGGRGYGVAYRSYFPRPFAVTTEREAYAYDCGVFFGELHKAVALTTYLQVTVPEPPPATVCDHIARRLSEMTACAGPEAVSTYATVMEAVWRDASAKTKAFWDAIAETPVGDTLQEDLDGTPEALHPNTVAGGAREEAG